jgi:hypothetical protein
VPLEPTQERLRRVDISLDRETGVTSVVKIGEKPLQNLCVAMTLKPRDYAWTEIDVEHDRLSLG